MSDQTHSAPRMRYPEDRELIPRILVRAMFSLALASLLIVSFAVLTGREPVGQPKPAEALANMDLIESEGLVENAARRGAQLQDELRRHLAEHPFVGACLEGMGDGGGCTGAPLITGPTGT